MTKTFSDHEILLHVWYGGDAGDISGLCNCKKHIPYISSFEDLAKISGPAGDLAGNTFINFCSCGFSEDFCECEFCESCESWENNNTDCMCERCDDCWFKIQDCKCSYCKYCKVSSPYGRCSCGFCSICGFKNNSKCICAPDYVRCTSCGTTEDYDYARGSECKSCNIAASYGCECRYCTSCGRQSCDPVVEGYCEGCKNEVLDEICDLYYAR